MSGWQPIETAPKDGTQVVGCDTTFAHVTRFEVMYEYVSRGPNIRHDGWFYKPVIGGPFMWKPTHWMPLPEPPKTD